ncbi:MAG TPA: methyltransferase domain-containing protein [Vicinamibacterales bacterium]|nr:methyltransferase domain-containing protein [Vicinamibacterales bacterium]
MPARGSGSFGIGSSAAYLSYLRRRLDDDTVGVVISRAERLPFTRAAFDLTVSALVLNFVDAARAIEEQRRVTLSGGCVTDIAAIPLDAIAAISLSFAKT